MASRTGSNISLVMLLNLSIRTTLYFMRIEAVNSVIIPIRLCVKRWGTWQLPLHKEFIKIYNGMSNLYFRKCMLHCLVTLSEYEVPCLKILSHEVQICLKIMSQEPKIFLIFLRYFFNSDPKNSQDSKSRYMDLLSRGDFHPRLRYAGHTLQISSGCEI